MKKTIASMAVFVIAISIGLTQFRTTMPTSPKKERKAAQKLEDCLRMADYIGRGKVASCKTTAELGSTASMSFANSFTTCIEQLDKIIPANRDACHKKYQK